MNVPLGSVCPVAIPSFEEIAEQFNYNSLATVHEHLSNLERKGYIKRSYNESRSIEILPSEAFAAAVELPLLGAVAAACFPAQPPGWPLRNGVGFQARQSRAVSLGQEVT